jgi:outer membrane receptor protein involved in Fe transport
MRIRSIASASVAIGALAIASAPAFAQSSASDAAPPAGSAQSGSAAANAVDGEIIVTGSRVARQGFEAPTPTIVLSAETLQQRGSTNVGDFLNEIPAFRPSQNSQTNTQTSTATGAVYADLRSLGNIRTLTLVDGRRHVPSASTGQVDLNLIPTILVSRIETVTGGASAAYGSDAVSGVVNIILDKKLQGFKGDFSTALSKYGDDWERKFSLGFGTAFQEDRGHIVVGGDYVKSNGVTSFGSRPWGPYVDEVVSFPTGRAAGLPSRIFARQTSYTNSTQGGVINGSCNTVGCTPTDTAAAPLIAALRGIQFLPGGAPAPFNYGNDPGIVAGTRPPTGTAYNLTSPDGSPTRLGHTLVLPVTHYVAMVHIDYDISDTISAFVEGSYARSGARFGGPGTRDTNTSTIVITRQNPFLPTSIRGTMVANGVQNISLGRHSIDYGQSIPDNKNTTERVVAGLNGKLFAGWSWDAYYEYGRNRYDSVVSPVRIDANFKFAVDAVAVNPTTNQIFDFTTGATPPANYVLTCRALVVGSTTYNPTAAAGCVPINLFGQGTPSAAAVAYSYGTSLQTITTTQQVAAANLRGNLFDTWAGPVAAAFGGEYRKDQAVSVVDSISQRRQFNFGNPQPYSGSFNVKEGYVEVDVPLAKDWAFAHSLNLNGAFRYTDYSFSGTVKTWKIGSTYEPVEGVKFRGVVSRDIRAPNAFELFTNLQNNSTFRNPFNGVTAAYTAFTTPSATLRPERATTKTGGVVLSPRMIPGLNLSVDYYKINLKDAISSIAGQSVLDLCFASITTANPGGGPFCQYVNRTGTTLNSVTIPTLNLASIKTEGVDFDLSYRHRLGSGSVTARVFGTYVAHLITDDGLGTLRSYNAAGILQTKGSVIDRAGQAGGFTTGTNTGATSVPHWQLNGSLTYANDRFSTSLQGRYIQGGKVDKSLVDPSEADYNAASPISVTGNDVSQRFYMNWSGSINIVNDGKNKLQFYAVVNNLTNVAPPFPNTQVAGLYDRIGRYYRVGLRFAY